MLLAVIGLAAMAVARAEVRTLQRNQEMYQARRLAEAGVEIALHTIEQDADWRNTYTSDQFVADQSFGDGTFKWKLVDEADNDLANNETDPVRIIAWGTRDGATQKVSTIYAPGSELGVNLVTNGDFEDGLTKWSAVSCVAVADSATPHLGIAGAKLTLRGSSSAGLQQVVTNSIENHHAYDIELFARAASGSAKVQVSFIIDSTGEGVRTINEGVSTSVTTTYTKVNVTLNPTWTGTLNSAKLRVHTGIGSDSFFLDDVLIVKTVTKEGPMGVVNNTWQREVEPIPAP